MRSRDPVSLGVRVRLNAWFFVALCAPACSSDTEGFNSRVENDRTSVSLSSAGDGTADNGGSVTTEVAPSSIATGIITSSPAETSDADGGALFTPEEQETLTVFEVADSVLENAHGEELVQLAGEVGFARGLAVCRCFFGPTAEDEQVHDCAVVEALTLWVFTETSRRPFAVEWIVDNPQFEPELRCQIRRSQLSGLYETAKCTGDPGPVEESACEVSEAFYEAIRQIEVAENCPDGKRVYAPRCNSKIDCADLSDERNCFEDLGRDMLSCNGFPLTPDEMCFGPSPCGFETTPPMCSPDMPGRFLCADGIDIDIQRACDRNDDCPDGSDEAPCLR